MTKLELTQSARRSLWRFMTLLRDLKSATDAVSSQNDQLWVSMLAAAFQILCKTASHAKTEEADHSAS